ASGMAHKSSTPKSNHSGIDGRIASSRPERNSAIWMASCPCKATDPTTICQFPRIDTSASPLFPAPETFPCPSASPQECLGIILGAPGSSPAPEATLERGAPSKGSYTTGLEEMHQDASHGRWNIGRTQAVPRRPATIALPKVVSPGYPLL